MADRTDWWRRPSLPGKTITAGSSLCGHLPPHAVYAAPFQPLAARQQTGFVVAASPDGPTESQHAEETIVSSSESVDDDEVAELQARYACASLVGTIAERVAGIPRNASAVALGDLAEEAELAELSELATSSQQALDLSGDSRPLTRNWSLQDKFEALKDLPPGNLPIINVLPLFVSALAERLHHVQLHRDAPVSKSSKYLPNCVLHSS